MFTCTIPSDFSSHSINPFAQLSMENQQSSIPVCAVSQYSQTFDKPPTKMARPFIFFPTSNNPTSAGNNVEFGSMSPFTNQRPSLQYPSSVELPLFPIPSLAPGTSIETQQLGEVTPKFDFRSSTFMAQAPDIIYSFFNPHLDPNLGYVNRVDDSSDPAWDKSIFYPSAIPVKVKRVYRCESCCVQFQTAQAFGGHMSYHSKVNKKKDREETIAPELDPAKLKKPKIELQIDSMNRGWPITIKVAKAKNAFEEVLNKYKYKKEGVEQETQMKNDPTEATARMTLPKENINSKTPSYVTNDLKFNKVDYMDLASFFKV